MGLVGSVGRNVGMELKSLCYFFLGWIENAGRWGAGRRSCSAQVPPIRVIALCGAMEGGKINTVRLHDPSPGFSGNLTACTSDGGRMQWATMSTKRKKINITVVSSLVLSLYIYIRHPSPFKSHLFLSISNPTSPPSSPLLTAFRIRRNP